MSHLSRVMRAAVLAALILGCRDNSTGPGNNRGGDGGDDGGDGGPPSPPAALLRDIVIPNLPAPYYHFEYDTAGRVSSASFASGFTMYQVIYQGERISQLHNNTLGNQDRLEYHYDTGGRVIRVDYVRPNDSVSTRVSLSYQGDRLVGLERQRLMGSTFLVDKTMTFAYYPDGNLQLLTEHRPAIAGFQPDQTTFDRFEGYDDGINVDGFGLLHNDFFDHLVLLPGVRLQRGNPARVTHSGDGAGYRVNTTYRYDDQGRPLAATGDLVFLSGPDTGRHFRTRSDFSYY